MNWIIAGLNFVIVAIAGAMGWFFVPLQAFSFIAGDLIQFFAILAALLMQVMLVTATIFSPGKMAAHRIKRITEALDAQQNQWRFLFVIYILAALLPLPLKMADGIDKLKLMQTAYEWAPVLFQAGAALISAVIALALVRSFEVIRGIVSLQALRHQLLLEERQEADIESRRIAAEKLQVVAASSDVGYGKKVSFPGGNQ